jgi:electron-transferring-flavoprotein dehydrogenase
MPVAAPLIEGDAVVGVRLADQGVDRKGNPEAGYLPGMDIRAGLTVVGDGPVGPVGRALDARFGTPGGRPPREWALGMKFVVTLREDTPLKAGTVLHTLGYPEPEIFGFLYVLPERTASLGIFLQSWTKSPVRTAYRYLQHWMQHPYLWRYLKGAALRSWGAKSLQESGRRAEPFLAGDGYARIGEGSGSTNVLTNSGVDEAWTTGALLAEGVLELLAAKQPFTKEHLEKAYVARRRASGLDAESRAAEKARDGFAHGFLPGLVGMGLRGLTGGVLGIPGTPEPPHAHVAALEPFFRTRVPPEEVARIRADCDAKGQPLHDAFMDRWGWPAIPMDGMLFVSHQDVLLMGGKVQAPAGFADHVLFPYPDVCRACTERVCIEACSGQAIMPGEGGVPAFDREKCVHCGACLWNCSRPRPGDPERACVEFQAGAGGLHSPEN